MVVNRILNYMFKKLNYKLKIKCYIYEAQTLLLNGVGYSYPTPTLVGHVSMKCPIQKVFVGFLKISSNKI